MDLKSKSTNGMSYFWLHVAIMQVKVVVSEITVKSVA